MKRLLLVDDDAVLTRAYRDRLSAHGFQVNSVGSGAGALILLGSAKPDLVVLDLMMPQVTGVDVLKLVREQPRLADTPVVVLANEPGNDLGQYAARIGVQKVFRKDQCSPSVLMAAIDEILEPRVLAAATQSETVADPVECRIENAECRMERTAEPEADPVECRIENTACRTERPAEPVLECRIQPSECRKEMDQGGTEENMAAARANFLADAPAICTALGELSAALSHEPLTGPEQQDHLQGLFLKVRFLVETASLTGLAPLAQAAAAFDAFLDALMENPERLGPSTLRTVESLVEVVRLLFQQARESGGGAPLSARVLVVDDDQVANEMVVDTLRRAQLDACSTEDSVAAWQWINSEHFDLVLLRMEMPVLNGLQLCDRLRKVPGYEKIPVIFVAAHDDPHARAARALLGPDDVIAKPGLPQELAARVVMRLVRTHPGFFLSGRDRTGVPQSTELVDGRFQIN